jgi:hypothetical protein
VTQVSSHVHLTSPWRRPLWRSATVALVLGSLGLAVYLSRELPFRGAADLWIVSDRITRADAVAIFGGGAEVRPFVAADLYRRGLVSKILISHVLEGPTVKIFAAPSHAELNRTILLKLGVPESAIGIFGKASQNTRDEALALRDWAEQNAVSVLIVPTEGFSARRVRWILYRTFIGKNIHIEVPSFESPQYIHSEWWRNERGVIDFQNEVMKYIYYRLKY